MKRGFIIAAILSLVFQTGNAQLSNVESKLIAAYLSSFHEKFEWPKGRDKGTFTIGILIDSTNVNSYLREFTNDKKVGPKKKRKIKVVEFNSISEIKANCHVLYLGTFVSYCDETIKELLEKKTGVLLVTYDTECQEKMVNIFGGTKLKFSIHKELLAQQEITVR